MVLPPDRSYSISVVVCRTTKVLSGYCLICQEREELKSNKLDMINEGERELDNLELELSPDSGGDGISPADKVHTCIIDLMQQIVRHERALVQRRDL